MNHPAVSQLLRSKDPKHEVFTHPWHRTFKVQKTRQPSYMIPLLETADSSVSVESSSVSTWSNELLLADKNSYDLSLALFKEDPNATTLTISDEFVRISEITVAKEWREKMGDELADRLRNDALGPGDDRLLSMKLETTLRDLTEDPRWLRARNRVNEFCLRAGSARTMENAFESIESLREVAIRFQGRDIELLAEIKLLKERLDAKDEELKRQRRIIEDLSYRHIMENIIDPEKWTGSYASDWRRFWDDAVNNTISVQNRAPRKPNSPIFGLVNQFGSGSIGSIKGTGGAMYGALSTNIHHYGGTLNDVYRLQCQRDKMPEEIMKAMTPLSTSIQNDKVDWAAERSRFI